MGTTNTEKIAALAQVVADIGKMLPPPNSTLAQRVRNGLASSGDRRLFFADVLPLAVEEAVNEQVRTEEADDRETLEHFGGEHECGERYTSIPWQRIEIELEDESLLAWYSEGRPGSFYGQADGVEWKAEIAKATRRRGLLTLRLNVEMN